MKPQVLHFCKDWKIAAFTLAGLGWSTFFGLRDLIVRSKSYGFLFLMDLTARSSVFRVLSLRSPFGRIATLFIPLEQISLEGCP